MRILQLGLFKIPYNYLFEKADGSFWCLKKHTFMTTANKTQVPPKAENILCRWLLTFASVLQSGGRMKGTVERKQKAATEGQAHLGYTCTCPCRYFLKSPQIKPVVRIQADWELPWLRQKRMVKTWWLAFHSKLLSSPFPCYPHC